MHQSLVARHDDDDKAEVRSVATLSFAFPKISWDDSKALN